jgi:hypothetical protein
MAKQSDFIGQFASLATLGQTVLDSAKELGLLKTNRRPYKRRASSSNGPNLDTIVMPEGEVVPVMEIDEAKPKRRYRKRRKSAKSVSLTEIETPTMTTRRKRQPVK